MNALGYLRVMFTVEDIDDTLARLGNAARSSSAKWSSMTTGIGSATSGAPKEFSSGSPNSSGHRLPERIPWAVGVEATDVRTIGRALLH